MSNFRSNQSGTKIIVSGSNDKTVRLWDAATGKPAARMNVFVAACVFIMSPHTD